MISSRKRHSLAFLTAFLMAGAVHAEPNGDRAVLERLSGTYASPTIENWYGAYGKREFTFEKGSWSLRFHLALDPELKKPVFEFRTGGPYKIGSQSAAVPNAYEAVFHETAKYVTLLTNDPGLIQGFGLAGCGLQLKVEADISAGGCANWKPVAECGEDHDLLAIDNVGALYFGVRPKDNNMCTADKRPKALLGPVVRR